nr:MAG TPA: hypothetical protein [Caudoviricetes sp.]
MTKATKELKERVTQNKKREGIVVKSIDYTKDNKNIIISTGRRLNDYLQKELKTYAESIADLVDNYKEGEKIALSKVCDCMFDLQVSRKIDKDDMKYFRLEVC